MKSLVNLALCNLHAQIPLYLMEHDAEGGGASPCRSDTPAKSLFLKGAHQPSVTWKLETFFCSISIEAEIFPGVTDQREDRLMLLHNFVVDGFQLAKCPVLEPKLKLH